MLIGNTIIECILVWWVTPVPDVWKVFFLPHAAWSKHGPVTANTPFMATQLCLFARMFTQLQDVSKLGLHPLKNAKVSHMSQKNESLQSIVFQTQIVWVFVFIWANRLYTRDSHSHLLLNNLWNLGYCCTCCDFCLDWEPTTPKPRTQNWKHPPKTRQDKTMQTVKMMVHKATIWAMFLDKNTIQFYMAALSLQHVHHSAVESFC